MFFHMHVASLYVELENGVKVVGEIRACRDVPQEEIQEKLKAMAKRAELEHESKAICYYAI